MNISNDIEPEWMSPGQAAKKFGVPRSTLYDWIKRGHIRSASLKERHQRHGKRLIEVKSVRAYIEAHLDVREVTSNLAEADDQEGLGA